jgi:hypothetical protein
LCSTVASGWRGNWTHGIGYLRRDNCLVNIDDFARAQKLADQQPRIAWPGQLERLLRRVVPQAGRFVGTPQPVPAQSYYWTSEQTEWATDLAFRDAASLAELYPLLARHGIETFQSPDVMRFLGHKLPAHGGVHGRARGIRGAFSLSWRCRRTETPCPDQ